MAPFFLDVWMEMALENQETATVKSEKKTLFFIPSNDDVVGKTGWTGNKDAASAETAS